MASLNPQHFLSYNLSAMHGSGGISISPPPLCPVVAEWLARQQSVPILYTLLYPRLGMESHQHSSNKAIFTSTLSLHWVSLGLSGFGGAGCTAFLLLQRLGELAGPGLVLHATPRLDCIFISSFQTLPGTGSPLTLYMSYQIQLQWQPSVKTN